MPRFLPVFDDQLCGSSAVSLDDLRIVAAETGDFEMPCLLSHLTHWLILSLVANAVFTRSWLS